MITNSEVKRQALGALKGHWGQAILVTLIFDVLSTLLQYNYGINLPLFSDVFPLVTYVFLITVLSFGVSYYFLRMSRGENCQIVDLFSGFKDYSRVMQTIFLQTLYIILWTLLLIVPGIVKSFSYVLTPFIIVDNKELSNSAAIDKSMKMMKGHKMQLFLLELGILWWFILLVIFCIVSSALLVLVSAGDLDCSFSLDILAYTVFASLGAIIVSMVFLMPYVYAVIARFYLSLKAELEPQVVEPLSEVSVNETAE